MILKMNDWASLASDSVLPVNQNFFALQLFLSLLLYISFLPQATDLMRNLLQMHKLEAASI